MLKHCRWLTILVFTHVLAVNGSSSVANFGKREMVTETRIQYESTDIDLGYYGAPGVDIETRTSYQSSWQPVGPVPGVRLGNLADPVGLRVAGVEDSAVAYAYSNPNGIYGAITFSVTYTKGYYTTPLTVLEGEIITRLSTSSSSSSDIFKRADPYDSSLSPLPYTQQTLLFGAERGCAQQYYFTAVIVDANNVTSTVVVTPYNQRWKLYIPEEKPYKVTITHDVDPEFLAEIVYLGNAVSYVKGDSPLITGIEYQEDFQVLVCPYGDDDRQEHVNGNAGFYTHDTK